MSEADDLDRKLASHSPQRRRFLVAVGISSLVALAIPLARRTETDLIESMLRDRLPDLRIESDELDRFTSDFMDHYLGANPRRRKAFFKGMDFLRTFLPDSAEQFVTTSMFKSQRESLERKLLNAFFLGTDYFQSRKKAMDSVTYLRWPDPYESGCTNILARFD